MFISLNTYMRILAETFTAIEVDSFGHFYLKAKTRVIESDKPVWNESFAIDLESASTLRLICYQRSENGDILLGKCPLNVSISLFAVPFFRSTLHSYCFK